jgi:homoserine kinase
MKTVTVFAPASVGNVSCGFDVLGFAIDAPGDKVSLTLNNSGKVVITEILPASVNLPRDIQRNTAGVAIKSYLNAIGSRAGVNVSLHKGLPLGSGMGSSAASAVAAVVAINHLLEQLDRIDLLPHALEAERIACGSAHADNVAPCLLGGVTLIREYQPLDVVKVPVVADLYCSLVHPHFEIRTEDARKILPSAISLKDAIVQSANTAALMVGLMKPDYELIGRSLFDAIAEPLRAKFIPDFYAIKNEAVEAGALGCGISGSGPTLFALCESNEIARRVGEKIKVGFERANFKSDVYVSKINQHGAIIIEG